MIDLLRDMWSMTKLRVRYRRLVQERLVSLVERGDETDRVLGESSGWTQLGCGPSALDEGQRVDLRTQARQAVLSHPHARNILRLMEIYVAGPGLTLTHVPRDVGRPVSEIIERGDQVWKEFLDHNRAHFSFREYARRTWRDGECFLRRFVADDGVARWPGAGAGQGPLDVRFVDPETIGDPVGRPGDQGESVQGVVTLPEDVEQPVAYLRVDPSSGELLEEIPAERVLHTKIGVDSNQKRGISIFCAVLPMLNRFSKWLDGELVARQLQASIVLWRRVQGSPSQVAAYADQAQGEAGHDPLSGDRRERIRAGTILTTSQSTDLRFLQPDTNFGDAVPLGRMLLLSVAAGQGLPEFMLTGDASNGNFASTMVAEGPAVKLFQAEQQFFLGEFERVWRWVMQDAIARGVLPATFFREVHPHWTVPELVNRDRPRERLADVRLVESQVLSRAEVARRDGVDPRIMRTEISQEQDLCPSNIVPGADDRSGEESD